MRTSTIWERIKSLKEHSSLILLGCAVFSIGLLFHFPLERFSSIIASNVQKQTGYTIQMEQMSLAFPIGLTAENVKVQPPPSMPDQFVLAIDKVTIRPSIFALLTYPFRKSMGFSYKALRGKEVWSGSANLGQDKTSLEVHVKNFVWGSVIPLDQNPMFAGQTIDIKTIVNIDLSFSGKTVAIQQGNVSEAEGTLEVTSKKTDIVAPFVKQLNITDLALQSDLKKGILTIKKFNFTAPNLSGKASGQFKVEPFFPNSSVQLDVQVKADPSDPTMSANLVTAASLLSVQPASDGSLSLKINGALNSPQTLSIRGSQ